VTVASSRHDADAWIPPRPERDAQCASARTTSPSIEAHNPTDRPVAGQATFNVVPYAAGGYFAKVQCFCFDGAGPAARRDCRDAGELYVDPAILDDPEGRFVREITLGYTFYEIDLPEETHAALDPVGALTAEAPASID
jgi:cytochrome c oxidase assembly protein subunit 11